MRRTNASQREREPGISVAQTGQQPLCPTVRGVGPRYSEWLADVLDALLPACESAVRALVDENDAVLEDGRVWPSTFPRDVLVDDLGVDANNEGYANSIVEWTAKWSAAGDELHSPADDLRDWCHACVTEVGTGQAPEGMDVDGLRRGPLRLLATRERTEALVLYLDGEAWTSLDDKRTGERALSVLSTLADVLDVRLVVSPRLRAHLERAYPEWSDENLTQDRDGSRHAEPPCADAVSEEERADAYDTLDTWGAQTGRVRLLANVPADGSRPTSALTDDPEIGVKEGSIYAYLGDLEAAGFVDVDRRSRPHAVSLTKLGEAAQALILPSYQLKHPAQQDLTTSLIQSGQATTSTVSRARSPREGGPGSSSPQAAGPLPTPEEWLCATDAPDDAECSGFVQWLNGGRDVPRINAYELHKRLLAGRRTEGVTCVDDRLDWFEHGRVSYLSCLEGEAQVVTQWGKSAATLGRLAATLSSQKMWGQVLTREQLGDDLGKIRGASGVAKDEFVEKFLQMGHQIGWTFAVDAERLDYSELSTRLHNVGRRCLKDIEQMQNGDATAKSALYRRALGLVTCMTKLLDAVGIDLTIHIRVPDVEQLRRDPTRFRDFTEFFRHTVPKQATYGVHSAWRQVGETRPDKLRFRLPMDVDRQEATADLTASWVVAGPGADELQGPLATALEGVDVRERVAEGREENIAISIPVVSGNSFAAIKSVVDDMFKRKGFAARPEDLRRLTRVLMGLLGTDEWHCSPFSAAEALLACAHSEGYSLTVGDVAHALSTLSADRIIPDASPGTRRMLKALLEADEPLSNAELIERADISRKTLYRHIEDLQAIAIVEQDDGGNWRLFIEPWWSAEASTDEPYLKATEAMRTAFTEMFPEDLLYEIAIQRGGDTLNKIHEIPWSDREEVLAGVANSIPWLAGWIPFVVALLQEPPADVDPRDRQVVVHLGDPSAVPDPAQTTLDGGVIAA